MARYLVGCVLYDSRERAVEEACKEALKLAGDSRKGRIVPVYQLIGEAVVPAAAASVKFKRAKR